MIAIDCQFASRAALREALLDDFPDGGLFVAGGYDVTAGSPVVLRVAVEGLVAPLFLEGLIQWRRTAPRVGDPSATRPGLGVRLLGSQRDRFHYLHQWCDGRVEDSGRRDVRFPFDHAMQIGLNAGTRKTGRIVLARLREVGEHGALVATPVKFNVSSMIAGAVTWEGKLFDMTARVAWASDDRAGLRVVAETPEAEANWARLFDGARAAFARRLIAPARPPSASSAPSSR